MLSSESGRTYCGVCVSGSPGCMLLIICVIVVIIFSWSVVHVCETNLTWYFIIVYASLEYPNAVYDSMNACKDYPL